ncbi:uncharacterized [Tachysurus ichikawai]
MTFCHQLILGFSIFLLDKLKITRCFMHSDTRRNPQTRKEEDEKEEDDNKLGMKQTATNRHKALQRQKQLGICACWL